MNRKGDKIREIRVEGPKCTLNLPDTCFDCKGKALSSEVAGSSQLAVRFLAFWLFTLSNFMLTTAHFSSLYICTTRMKRG
ncbi:hypothetical protein NC651_027968 [Populus alba x Populus x berolinensis]|nr:hypothetical protein NC651_027968 [Populus alba x Populus x berolinensis]